MLKKRIPLYATILMTVAGMAISAIIALSIQNSNNQSIKEEDKSLSSCTPEIKRLSGMEFTKPLLFADISTQSASLLPVKNQLEVLINNYKLSGTIQTASVYLRELNKSEWISIGDSEKYFPGSLLKVPELITFFKMNEKNPGLLNKHISYSTAFNLPKQGYYLSKSIEVGKSYTVKELLYYMIAYSDNNATMLLNQQMDVEVFRKVFTDLGLPSPDLTKHDIPVTAKEYSYFMRALYNASYLDIRDSELCTELLSHSDFDKGLLNGLPKNTKVAHKFGEAGDASAAHFGESGIIYLNDSPYLLVVMTKGKDNKSLPAVVSDISKKVFEMIHPA